MKKIILTGLIGILVSYGVSFVLYLLAPVPSSNICIHSLTLEEVDCTTGVPIQG